MDKILVDDINGRIDLLQKRILDGTATNDEVDEFTKFAIRFQITFNPY